MTGSTGFVMRIISESLVMPALFTMPFTGGEVFADGPGNGVKLLRIGDVHRVGGILGAQFPGGFLQVFLQHIKGGHGPALLNELSGDLEADTPAAPLTTQCFSLICPPHHHSSQ